MRSLIEHSDICLDQEREHRLARDRDGRALAYMNEIKRLDLPSERNLVRGHFPGDAPGSQEVPPETLTPTVETDPAPQGG